MSKIRRHKYIIDFTCIVFTGPNGVIYSSLDHLPSMPCLSAWQHGIRTYVIVDKGRNGAKAIADFVRLFPVERHLYVKSKQNETDLIVSVRTCDRLDLAGSKYESSYYRPVLASSVDVTDGELSNLFRLQWTHRNSPVSCSFEDDTNIFPSVFMNIERQKYNAFDLEVRESAVSGMGVFSTRDINSDENILEIQGLIFREGLLNADLKTSFQERIVQLSNCSLFITAETIPSYLNFTTNRGLANVAFCVSSSFESALFSSKGSKIPSGIFLI